MDDARFDALTRRLAGRGVPPRRAAGAREPDGSRAAWPSGPGGGRRCGLREHVCPSAGWAHT